MSVTAAAVAMRMLLALAAMMLSLAAQAVDLLAQIAQFLLLLTPLSQLALQASEFVSQPVQCFANVALASVAVMTATAMAV
jgi:hypothetical protein